MNRNSDIKHSKHSGNSEIEQLVAQCSALNNAPVITVEAAVLKGNTLAAALKRAGLTVILVDRAPVYSKETLLHALYQNTPLPGYFGFNWDALQDALADFSWLEALPKGTVLLLKDATRFKAAATEDWETFVEIVSAVSALWAKKRQRPFHLITAG